MKFAKYPKIENTYRRDFLDHIIDEGKADGTWVVTEKIHGTNFSFWANKKEVRMGKRSALLPDDTGFYGINNIAYFMKPKTRALLKLFPPSRPRQWKQIAVYGELFGGSYPHPKVCANSQAKKVQSGIYYCPDNQFMIFDIKVDDEYLDFSEMQEACEKVGLPYIRALATGTLEECLKHKNDFSSTIHKYFHLPKIKDNICEGIVIRPNKTKFLYRGSRVILKSKNDKWSEKAHPKKPIENIEISDAASKVKEEIKSMITENRFNSVISKIGEVTVAHFGQIMKDFSKDILDEAYESELAYQFNALDKSEQKIVKKAMNHNIANLVRRKLILGE